MSLAFTIDAHARQVTIGCLDDPTHDGWGVSGGARRRQAALTRSGATRLPMRGRLVARDVAVRATVETRVSGGLIAAGCQRDASECPGDRVSWGAL
jgi:hypothetical protein